MNLKKLIPTRFKTFYRKRQILRKLKGNDVECNLCEWHGAKFLDDAWHERVMCPNCSSDVRHRLLWAGLMLLPEFSADLLAKSKEILHFAPEPQLREKLEKIAGHYITSDFENSGGNLKLDISRMDSVQSESYDLVIACDVLEHVPNDQAALREIFRILRPGGAVILTVPQKDQTLETHEDSNITDPKERERVFGQWNHLRIYGSDFSDRMKSAGFEVAVLDAESFPDSTAARNVLRPPRLSAHPLATNYRKVYFGRKL